MSLPISTTILNINTKFRNNYDNTQSTNFVYNLPYTMKNVVSMEYVASEFANTPFIINSKFGSNNFKITDKATGIAHTIVIPEGNYSGPELASAIKENISTTVSGQDANNRIDVSFNNNSKKFQFFTTATAPKTIADLSFDLDFTYNILDKNDEQYCSNYKTIRENQLSLGWIMGFRKQQYSFSTDYKATDDTTAGKYLKGYYTEGVYDRNGSRYYLLAVNDFNNNHKNNIVSSFQRDTLIDNNIITKFKYNVDPDYHSVDTDKTVDVIREYPGKVDINRLQIRLLDEYGRVADLDNMDYSISLKIDTID